MMVSKVITILEQTATFNEDIRKWRHKNINLKTWDMFETFFRQAHREQHIAVATTVKGGYTKGVQNIYGVPPPPPEEHHKAIYNLNNIVQGIQTQSYELDRQKPMQSLPAQT